MDYENFDNSMMDNEPVTEPIDSAGEIYQESVMTEQIPLNCEGIYQENKRNNGKIIGIIVAGVIVFALLIALLWSPIINLLGFGKPYDTAQEHFVYVETQNMNQFADSFSASYGDYLANYTENAAAGEAEMHLLLNRDILALIGAYAGIDVSWLDDIAVRMETAMDGDKFSVRYIIGLHGADIVAAEIIIDYQNQVILLGVPELNDSYISVDIADVNGNQEMFIDMHTAREIMEQLPSEQEMNKLLRKYLNIVVSNIKNVTSTSQTVTVEGISQKCTALEAKIDIHTVGDIVIAVLQEAKNDQVIIECIQNLIRHSDTQGTSATEFDWSNIIDDAIDQVREDIASNDDNSYITWTDYVDNKDAIIGRIFHESDTDEPLGYLTVTDGERFAYELNLADAFVLTGTGTNINHSINGKFSLLVSGMNFLQFELIDMNEKQLDQGNLCGTVRISASNFIMSMLLGSVADLDMALDLVLDTAGTTSNVDLKFTIQGQVLASISLMCRENEPYTVIMPDESIIITDEAALDAWVSEMDFEDILENLEKAGVPAQYLDYLTALFSTVE